MSAQTGITLRRVCEYFRIDFEVVREFADYGLYPTVLCDGEMAIEAGNLDRLKRIISMHQAIGINKEGIEVILNLGERISGLQREIETLQNEVERLRRHLGPQEPETLKRLGLLIEIDEGI